MSSEKYTSFNEVHVKGKIFNIVQKKHYTDLFLSVGHGPDRHLPKNKNGLYKRDVIRVRFVEGNPRNIISEYKKGDKVSIGAYAQTEVDILTNRNKKTSLFGFTAAPMNEKEYDSNHFDIIGKINTARAVSSNYIILNIKTSGEKKIKNLNPDSDIPFFVKPFNGSVSLGIKLNGNAEDLVYTKYTPGTWVSASGHVQGRKNKDNKAEIRLIATKHEIVGQVQKWNYKD